MMSKGGSNATRMTGLKHLMPATGIKVFVSCFKLAIPIILKISLSMEIVSVNSLTSLSLYLHRILAPTTYIFLASAIPVIAFGEQLSRNTGEANFTHTYTKFYTSFHHNLHFEDNEDITSFSKGGILYPVSHRWGLLVPEGEAGNPLPPSAPS